MGWLKLGSDTLICVVRVDETIVSAWDELTASDEAASAKTRRAARRMIPSLALILRLRSAEEQQKQVRSPNSSRGRATAYNGLQRNPPIASKRSIQRRR